MNSNFWQRMKIDRYVDENGNVVFTERYLSSRGSCCGYGCRHCPYTPQHQVGNTVLTRELQDYWKTIRFP
jgi:hypothetical protein